MKIAFGGPEEWPDLIPVEQIDRDTAVEAGRTWAHWTEGQITKALEGRGDYAPLIQLMARHRLAVLAAQGMSAGTVETQSGSGA
ncbi:MAG TPA: hypothetical protein VF637_05830 [Sphingomicrobium sp.]|jgi:hypothetical protein